MRYADIVVLPSKLRTRNVKKHHVTEYPRLDEADSHYLGRSPTRLTCTITVLSWEDLVALKQAALMHTEALLYVDQTGTDSHYYKRVVLELGEEERFVAGWGWRVPATFIALDPYLYDAATNEVVY